MLFQIPQKRKHARKMKPIGYMPRGLTYSLFEMDSTKRKHFHNLLSNLNSAHN